MAKFLEAGLGMANQEATTPVLVSRCDQAHGFWNLQLFPCRRKRARGSFERADCKSADGQSGRTAVEATRNRARRSARRETSRKIVRLSAYDSAGIGATAYALLDRRNVNAGEKFWLTVVANQIFERHHFRCIL